MDALPMVGSEAAVTLMTQMLTRDDVTGLEAKAWVMSLALVHEPTLGMVSKAKAVLGKPALRDDALLPVSTLLNNFCHNNQGCATETAVVELMDAIEATIGSSCYVNKKNIEQVCFYSEVFSFEIE